MRRWKEIATPASRLEAFHASLHPSMWLSATRLTVFGTTIHTVWNSASAASNTVIAVLRGVYAWGRRADRGAT